MTDSRSKVDLYVGYRTDNPRSQSRFSRRVTLLLLAGVVMLGALFAVAQQTFDPGSFEFGEVRTVEGTLYVAPQPHLRLHRPLPLPNQAATSRPEVLVEELLLVDFGKHGATGLAGLDGAQVRARGSLIFRGSTAMLELAEPPQRNDAATTVPAVDATVGRPIRLTGEIVDSKCALGVMKPGRGKVHRACATLCLDGGIPPAFLVRGADGQEWIALLLDADGAPPTESLAPWVGEGLSLDGELHEPAGGVARFRVDLAAQLP